MAAPTLPLMAPVNWLVDQVAARVTGRPASLRWDAPRSTPFGAGPASSPSGSRTCGWRA